MQEGVPLRAAVLTENQLTADPPAVSCLQNILSASGQAFAAGRWELPFHCWYSHATLSESVNRHFTTRTCTGCCLHHNRCSLTRHNTMPSTTASCIAAVLLAATQETHSPLPQEGSAVLAL